MAYEDPKNTEDIIENIKNCPTIKEINDLVELTFPKWILYYLIFV
jgi:hypothetical protein